ncbi:MAG: OprO/OprP family phosphate-selective porin [Methylophilaceae bacterium]
MNFKLGTIATATVAILMLSFGGNAMADSTDDIVNILVAKGVLTEEEGALIRNSRTDEKEANAKRAKKIPKITTKGKLKIEGSDGNWSFQPIGRVMWDAIDTDEDGSGTEGIGGTELRRARLGFQGTIYDYGYKFEADFAGGDVSIKDAYVSYGTKLDVLGGNKFGVKLGQSHIPFGLNTKISSKYMSFMDRPLFADSTISPARESGAVVSLADPEYKWALAAGITNGEIDGGGTNNNGSTFAVRGSFVPYMQDKTHLVQIGGGYLTKGGGDDFRFRQRLVSHEDQTRHIDTGTLTDFDGADAFTVDAMGIFGSFHAMAEYVDYSAEIGSASDVDIDGYVVEAGYFLTGESLVWKNGYTSGIKPKSMLGAWQVAARFESLEIDGGTAATTDEADKFSIGLNYYPHQNLRFMLNYDKITDLTKNGADVDFEPSALKFRAQAHW